MENLGRPIGIDVKLENGRALRAEATFVVRAAGSALDVDDLAIYHVDESGATDRTVRTDTRGGFRPLDAQLLGARDSGRKVNT